MQTHVNVVICTPGFNLTSKYVRSFLDTINELNNKGITWAFSNEFSSHVADAREITLSATRKNDYYNNLPFSGDLDYDKVFWIDSDMVWTPNDFMKIYESDKDIIGGAYLAGSGEVMAYPTMLKTGYMFDDIIKMSGEVEVEGIGFGFIAMKKGVFESLSRPWFQMASVKKTEADGSIKEYPILGEDLSFCQRISEKGFKIWLDTDVKLIHQKTMNLTWEGPQAI